MTGAATPTRRPPPGPKTKPPRLAHERDLWGQGHRVVAGVDEVGRGAWAGPLSVGVAVLAEPVQPGRRSPKGLRDSKLLTEEQRERLFTPLGGWCAAWAVGHASPLECDQLGMTAALRLASARAFAQLPAGMLPDAVVLDGNFDYVSPPAAPQLFAPPELVPGWSPTVRTVIGADRTCVSVAAASVLAKVTRDRQMRGMADSFPAFDFDRNKGYPSPTHKVALRGYGLTAVHRRTWAFVEHLPWR